MADADPSVTAKCANLETSYRESAAITNRRWRIDKLALEGAVGIIDGQGRTKIELDLAAVPPGVVALVGPSGSGKTTTIENMIPWARLLTRRGALSHHFEKPWTRTLHFSSDGVQYTSQIGTDGTFLYQGERDPRGPAADSYTVVAERAAEYEAEIDNLFGDIELYVRSVFMPQKPPHDLPRLSACPPKQRKELMIRLTGLHRYEFYAGEAKDRADKLDVQLVRELHERDILTGKVEELKDAPAVLAVAEAEVAELAGKVETSREEWEAAALEEANLGRKVEAFEQKQKRAAEVAETITALDLAREDCERSLKLLDTRVASLEAAQETLATVAKLEEQRDTEQKRVETVIATNHAAKLTHESNVKMADAAKAEAAIEIRDRNLSLAGLREGQGRRREELAKLRMEIDRHDGINCSTCGQVLPAGQREAATNHLEVLQNSATQLRDDQDASADAYRNIEEWLQPWLSRQQNLTKAIPPVLEDTNAEELQRLHALIGTYGVDQARSTVAANETATLDRERINGKMAQLDEQLATVYGQQNELALWFRTAGNVTSQWVYARADTKRLAEEHLAISGRKSAQELASTQLAEQVKRLEELLKDLDVFNASALVSEGDLNEWRFLERACGRDGIQALELSAAGPAVAATANEILAAAYGDRFRVDFETQRPSADGHRMIEDFQIYVTDKERGRRKLLENLSGGEEAWVERALMDAFAYVRQQTEGVAFETVFSDEADAMLDDEQSKAFLAMVQKGHEILGRRHSILITHNSAVQDRVPTKLLMEEL
jgi:exonuclease SbcC